MNGLKQAIGICALLTGTGLLSCGQGNRLAGTVTDTGNPTVSAVIVDQAGRPVAKEKVGLFSRDFNPILLYSMGKRVLSASAGDSLQEVTDQNGHVEFSHVPPDSYNIVGISDSLKYRLFKQVIVLSGDKYPGGRLALNTMRLKEPGQVVLRLVSPSPDLWFVVPGTAIAQHLDSTGVVTVLIPADTFPRIEIVRRPGIGPDSVMQTVSNVMVAQGEVADLTGIPDSVFAPAVFTADTTVRIGALLSATARGAVSNKGFALQYRFYWGDTFVSLWSADSVQSHQWSAAGTYMVQAQARIGKDTSIISAWSLAKPVTVFDTATKPGPLSYSSNPAVFSTGVTITPDTCTNRGAAADSFIIAPPLPAGLSFNRRSGIITGTPDSVSAQQKYKVMAINTSGIDSVFLSITVKSLDFTYFADTSGYIVIEKYIGSDTNVDVPSAVGFHPVVSIGRSAFKDCARLTAITIPASVTSIMDSAFWGDSALISITIPSGVTYIGNFAFCYCIRLAGITIPANVTYIGDGAFNYCGGLRNVIVQATTPPVLGGSGLFTGDSLSFVISVPSASLPAYQSATYWSSYAGYMVGY